MTNSPRPRHKNIKTIVLAGGALAMTAGLIAPGIATAQAYGQPQYDQGQYNQGQGQGQYDQGQYNQGQYQGQPNGQDYRNPNPPPEPVAPDGYDGTRPPPPPPGYAAGPNDQQYAAQDRIYAQNAEAWARNNCVKSRGNVAGGAAVGGILGALIGGALGGRHDRGAGVLAGAAVGAVGGAAVASSTGGETSPGCPPGFVVRGGAPAWGYAPDGYYYAAPTWYRPWVFIDGGWVYRPYPYHDFYYRTWRAGPGWHGGPGWRRGPGWHH
jgi:hypothetical protein